MLRERGGARNLHPLCVSGSVGRNPPALRPEGEAPPHGGGAGCPNATARPVAAPAARTCPNPAASTVSSAATRNNGASGGPQGSVIMRVTRKREIPPPSDNVRAHEAHYPPSPPCLFVRLPA